MISVWAWVKPKFQMLNVKAGRSFLFEKLGGKNY